MRDVYFYALLNIQTLFNFQPQLSYSTISLIPLSSPAATLSPLLQKGRARYGVHFNKRRKQEVRTVNPYFTLNKKEKVRWIAHAEPFT